MAIHIEPEKGVAMRPETKLKDLAVKASAASETAKHLHENGLEIKPNKEDMIDIDNLDDWEKAENYINNQ